MGSNLKPLLERQNSGTLVAPLLAVSSAILAID
jgi:hypothetical protein